MRSSPQRILTTHTGSLPRPEDHEIVISGQRMKALGLTLPASLQNCNCVVE